MTNLVEQHEEVEESKEEIVKAPSKKSAVQEIKENPRTKFKKFGIYYYNCSECDDGIQALHEKRCINPDCKSNNKFYQESEVDKDAWSQCKATLRP